MAKNKKRSSRAVVTRSGKTLKANQSLSARWKSRKMARAQRRVERLRGLPKSRLKRIKWRLSPHHLREYWFSRDGAIMALKLLGISILLLFILTLAVFAYFRKDLPKLNDISGDNLGGSISYYDRTGTTLLWQDYSAVKRVPVKSDEISNYMKQATVAIEDRDFYNHKGFDIKGIFRAAFVDIIKHSSAQGGSTITQQLVKLTQDFNQNRSIALKFKELILAVEVERTYTKDQILTGYLNAAPYGGVDYGVQAASSDYFHKNAKDLTLAEAAMLASIPKSPTYYSPYNKVYFDRTMLLNRQHYVLDVMVQTGKITKAQAEEAKKVDVLAEVQPQSTKYAGIRAPYFVLAAKNQLQKEFVPSDGNGSAKIGGWKITTTLDLNLQIKAEQLVSDNYANISRYGADESALVAEDVKTGQMVALVGGTDFNNEDHGNINYAQWYISPGSSFKPYDYVSLIENTTNAGAGSVLYDVQQALPGYSCTVKGLPPPKGQSNCLQDYDFNYPGPLTLRYAIGGSRNVPAVKAMLTVGTDKVINTANDLMNAPGAYKCFTPGVDVNTATSADEAQCYGASAIGDGAYLHLDQHVNGLASLARLGVSIPQTYILKIDDSTNKTVYQWKQPKLGDANVKQVVRAESAYILNDMLSDPKASYLPSNNKWQSYKGWKTAVKTGTTNNGFDGLMTGWNTQYAVGSWVGYHTRNKALSTFMENLTTPLTKGLMTYALDSLKTSPTNWTEPSGIQHLPAYVVTTHVGVGSVEPSPSNDIFPSWYKAKSNSNQSSVVDKVSNKTATSCTPDMAKNTLSGNASDNLFSADVFYPPGSGGSGSSSGSATSDDVHSCSDTMPTIASAFVNNTDVVSGGTATCLTGAACTITATVTAGTHPFNDSQYPQYPGTVNLLVDGQVSQTQAVSDSPATVSFTYTGTGTHTIALQVIDSVLFNAKSGDVALTVQ